MQIRSLSHKSSIISNHCPKIKLSAFSALALFAIMTLLSIFNPNTASVSAASTAGFNPGNIITDYVMSNYTTMSVSDINNFLHSKNSCNDTDISKAYRYSSYSYHIENGHFVCMADESFNGKSAAQIIYDAAQTYRINPQVLIVLLQKEQGLVTDTWPNSIQYRSATGYGCPDTAACDTKYYGFENQVNNAAALFRSVLDGGWSNYTVGYNYIQYNPNSYCGGTTVYIQNRATASLYRYTPYQPNESALAAGYGVGDGCGAYGNRNFYLYFTDWFGSTQTSVSVSFSPSIYLPDGEYTISSIGNQSLTVQADNNIIISTNGARFQFIRSSDDYFYHIKEVSTGLYVDIKGDKYANESNVALSEYDSYDCSQKWHLSRNAQTGLYTIASACFGLAMDVYYGQVNTPNTNVWIYESNETEAQTWQLINNSFPLIENDTYYVTSTSGYALDVLGNSKEKGANLQVYTRNNTAAQQFQFTKTKEGFYSIKGVGSGNYIDIKDASRNDGANAWMHTGNNTCAQLWYPEASSNYYILHSACSNKALDITYGVQQSGSNVQQWQNNYTDAQKWSLTKVLASQPSGQDGSNQNNIHSNSTDSTSNVSNNTNSLNTNPSFSPSIYLPDGEFTISTTGNQSLIVQANNNLAIDSVGSKFNFIRTADGFYYIKELSSGLYADFNGNNNGDGSNIFLSEYNQSSCSQKWHISRSKETSLYTILSSCSALAMDVSSAQISTPGTNVWLYANNGTAAQAWQLINNSSAIIEDGAYYATSTSGYVLDVYGNSKEDGANLQIYTQNNTTAQHFQFTKTYEGYYTIVGTASGNYVDLYSASSDNGTNIHMYTGNNTCAQLWYPEVSGEYIIIHSACSGKALDITNGVQQPSGNIQQWQGNYTDAQKWKLVKL